MSEVVVVSVVVECVADVVLTLNGNTNTEFVVYSKLYSKRSQSLCSLSSVVVAAVPPPPLGSISIDPNRYYCRWDSGAATAA